MNYISAMYEKVCAVSLHRFYVLMYAIYVRKYGDGEKKIDIEILSDLHVFRTSEYENLLRMRK
jgi:hypothetical protein